jgi:hypothetical protein
VTLTVATREAEVNISLGWFCLLGEALGAFRVATAKKFYKSDFANQEGVITEEEQKTEVTLTPLMRWMIVGVCIAVAIYGGIPIQDDHAWNPFSNGGPPALTR